MSLFPFIYVVNATAGSTNWFPLHYAKLASYTHDKFSTVSGAGNLLNAILDPILIFLLGLGIGGAAISTVISEYVKNVVKLKFRCAQCMDFLRMIYCYCFYSYFIIFLLFIIISDIWLLLSSYGSWMTKCFSSLQTLMEWGLPSI